MYLFFNDYLFYNITATIDLVLTEIGFRKIHKEIVCKATECSSENIHYRRKSWKKKSGAGEVGI